MPSKISTLALTAIALASGAEASEFPAIIGGTNVPSGTNRFLTSLQTTGGSHFCGGSLIAPNVVLTAAHCVSSGSTNFRVKLDIVDLRESGIVRSPSRVYVHESYNSNTIRNDIAIIELSQPVTTVTPINVDKTTTNAQLNSGSKGSYTIAGWGLTVGGVSSSAPAIMQQTTLPVVPDTTCDNTSPFNTGLHAASMVCIGDQSGARTACNGDSGGPMFQGNTQIGLTSWGAQGCGTWAVYTQLPYFASWIDSKLELINGSEPPSSTTCACVGGNDLDVGTTCGNWLNAGFNWCYSDVPCTGATESARYPGYYWFECSASRMDLVYSLEKARMNVPADLSLGGEKFYKAGGPAGVVEEEQAPATSDLTAVLGGVGIGFVSAGIVAAGMFALYKKQRDSSIEAAIDRVEAERRVVSSQYNKSDV